jgi:SET domain-containing protein
MTQRATPPMIEVRHSPVHGHGVFALRRIRRGTTVIEYLGERVTHEEADDRYSDKDPADNHTFLFTVDAKTVIDGGVQGNDARFINHGCDPNCQSTTRNKRIYIEAIRTIQPGEELAYDYQIDRDGDDPPDVDEVFACRCGAAKCRGSMLVARKKPRKKPLKKRPETAAATSAKRRAGKTKRRARTELARRRVVRGARRRGAAR